MSISSTSRKTALFTGNGSTTSFPFTFKVQDDDDVVVYQLEDDVETVVSPGDYTVTLNGNQDSNPGGSVEFDTAPTADQQVIITTEAEATQDVALQNQGSFNPVILNAAFDKLTILVQQLVEKFTRTARVPITTGSQDDLPIPENGKVLAWAGGAFSWVSTFTGDLVSEFMSSAIMVSTAHAFAKAVDGSLTLANYAALKALTGKAANVIYIVKGRSTAGDGGGGIFRYDGSSAATDDGGTCLANDVGGGRSLRIFSGPAISSWFFPSDGTTQTTALQALLTNHRYIRMENGTVVSAALSIPADTYVFGSRLAIIKQSSTVGDFITYAGDNVEICGVTIDGNQTTDTFAGGYTANHNGVVCTGTSGTPKVNARLTDCALKNFGMHAVKFKFVNKQYVIGNAIQRCGHAGIGLLSPLDGWVQNNHVTNIFPGDGFANAYGIYSSNSVGDRVSNNVHIAHNNVSEVLPWEGIDIHDGEHCTITDNFVTNCSQGIVYENHTAGAPGDDIRIDNNTILGWSGLTTTKDSQTYYKIGGIIANGADTNEQGSTVSICNNNITAMGDTRVTASAGAIYARSWDGFNISGNHIRDSYRAAIVLADGGTAGVTDGICGNNNIINVTLHDGVCRGIEAGLLTRGVAPNNRVSGLSSGTERFYQSATSTRKLHFTPAAGPAVAPGGRLSVSTGTPVTTADVTAAATLYYTPFHSTLVPLYDGADWPTFTFAELSLALDADSGHTGYHQSGKNFDAFLFLDAGTMRLGTGPAWTNDTTRADALVRVNGVFVNNASIVIRFGSAAGNTVSVAANMALYLGTIRASANGQTEDSLAKRFVWNCHNRIPRAMQVKESTDTWAYSTATVRQANGAPGNQLAYVCGLNEDMVKAWAAARVVNDNSTVRAVQSGVGLDSTSAFAGLIGSSVCTDTVPGLPGGSYVGFPGQGYHFLAWLENGAGAGTQTWQGDGGTPLIMQTGIQGEVRA